MTKEELLQKGISSEVADEIIAAFEEGKDENSLSALQKALDGEASESLFKAKEGGKGKEKKEEGEEDEENDDYNEEYMKKHMKRYMKECGEAGEKMKKAIDSFDTEAEGAIIEMADLKPILETIPSQLSAMEKAIDLMQKQIVVISDKNEKAYDLMQKSARVQVEQANSLGEFLSTPQGKKSVSTVSMTKASQIQMIPQSANKLVYTTLMKAVKAGDEKAGQVISAFESHGHDVNKLNPVQKQYVGELLAKEAN